MCRAVTGAAREPAQDGERLPFAGSLVALAEDVARARLVQRRDEHEPARLDARTRRVRAGRAADAPAGERAGELGDVVLAVAAAHAGRVQLEDLARQVLVEAALALGVGGGGALRGEALGADRADLVEVDQHRRVTLDRDQQRLERAEHVRPDRLGLERAGDRSERRLLDRDREVVGPEVDQRSANGAGVTSAVVTRAATAAR
jgi:hypothetical protein